MHVDLVDMRQVLEDITNMVDEELCPQKRPMAISQASRVKCKNDNWTDQELREAIIAWNGGINIKQTSEKFYIL